jgi:hypothetical protein
MEVFFTELPAEEHTKKYIHAYGIEKDEMSDETLP